MRAIIIDDKDSRALLERLELAKFRHRDGYGQLQKIMEQHGVSSDEMQFAAEEMHRWFHYVVCSWLQEQGASIVR